jgi:hypothetical protein
MLLTFFLGVRLMCEKVLLFSFAQSAKHDIRNMIFGLVGITKRNIEILSELKTIIATKCLLKLEPHVALETIVKCLLLKEIPSV